MRVVPPPEQCWIQLTAESKSIASLSEGIFLPTALNDGIFPNWKKVQIKTLVLSFFCASSVWNLHLLYERWRQLSITAAAPSFPVVDADLSHAHAISALDLYIHHISELDYSSQVYFMCVT